MSVLILGGDGFIGWPLALQIVSEGDDVVIADNLLRRHIDKELSVSSIVPISSIHERCEASNSVFFGKLFFEYLDVSTEYDKLLSILLKYNIKTVVHLAEIKSAPYSMIDANHASMTVKNNTSATVNILNAIAFNNLDIHLVHMGTMGVYGYKDDFGKIPEGYLDITVDQTGAKTSILFPTDPGSVYHMTKSLDQIMFQFYNKNWNMKITDLHQGIVWGCQTKNTSISPQLANRFDYDGTHGTVLNRFIVEGVMGYPLSVHGSGGQARAFIHIEDSIDCLIRSIKNPPDSSSVRVFNQVAEVLRVIDIAKYISSITGTSIDFLDNPRNERSENNLEVENYGLRSIGFEPTLMEDSLISDIRHIAELYMHRVKKESIDSTKYRWK